ncbi:TetR/AcrR family transcriptional regulator [Lentzea sp. JNUCC 0626]|uniref:TetR/AcrR family transcriptional regulator n=1 Tax=Lentzea sp. JNUCC 0626 TaxID=3367513 RepID=UPI0037498447
MAIGRPREFDTDAVLDAAMRVFWAKGYEGATMSDLTTATNLKPGSIYAAFGSKTGLFKQAVDRYIATIFAYGPAALAAPTAREVTRLFLLGAVDATTGSDTPAGCLLVQSALSPGDTALEAKAELNDRWRAAEEILTSRFAQALEEGDLPAGTDPRDVAVYVLSVSQGFAVQASTGASREQLRRIVDLTMRTLPWE